MDWLRDKVQRWPCWSSSKEAVARRPSRRETLPRPPQVADITELAVSDPIYVRDVDPKLVTNGTAHRTENFDLMRREDNPGLVVRRGQPFLLDLKLSRAYSEPQDAISFIFTVTDAEKPNYGQGTLIGIPLLSKAAKGNAIWKANVEQSVENILTVSITPSADCNIGKWKMEIDTKLKSTNVALGYAYKQPIFILFNPWCRSDMVYMESEEKKKEYVLTDTGLMWRGSHSRFQPTVWKYAQFERDVLECCLYLVNVVGRVPLSTSNNPVLIARALSAAVNSPDDNGAIMGNWTTDFDGGTKPTDWVGSMKILQKYYKTKKPVKYGQCWVFTGVLTTVCRALGIPSRPVTTYSAAHDTQNSLTVDYFIGDDGKVMEELNSDSIWNYHVWCEAWMRRDDLGAEYSGWQAIDATPQELSEDMFRCGPASVAAVKKGEVARPYDSSFVYAEVNADKVFWRYAGPTQPLKLVRKDTLAIGVSVSTKAVGKWTREDITHTYKYQEKTDDERAAMLKALKQSESLYSRYYLNEEFNDIRFDFKLRDDIVIGSPFSVVLVMENHDKNKDYTVSAILRVDTVLYTGKVQDSVKREKKEVVIKARTVEEIKMDVYYDEYSSKLVDQCAFNIACLATVQDTRYEYFAQDDFRVRKPDIKIKIDGDIIKDKTVHATACLTNPLPVPLKKGEFHIEGTGLESHLKLKIDHPVEPKGEARVDFKITPTTVGRGNLVARFKAKELDDVDGFHNFMVIDKSSENNGVSNNIPL